ncbi:MAG: DUF4857 domain-containing protein [Candidatus Marinimicrobia bacterium]|nr:DUF4857 domain-containing protein [Candidatus Neomarinimicrobiota bacterium]
MIFNKLARYGLILLIIIISAVELPFFYHKIVHKPAIGPRFYFSPITKNFMIMKHDKGGMGFYDDHWKSLTRREFEKYLPFQFYRDLSKWGELPDSIDGFAIDASVIHHNSDYYRIMGKDFDFPTIDLYPLFESQSDFAQLQFPGEFFRIKDKIDFITASSNEINQEMSEKFNAALIEAGFTFPAKLIAGLPTTKKPFDEGYFILDSQNDVFHMKKVKGEPSIVKTNIPRDLNIVKIVIQESVQQKIYGFIITANHDLFMISYDHYRLLPVKLEDYNAQKMDLSIAVDPFYVNFSYDDNTRFFSTICDSNYIKINQTSMSLQPLEEKLSEKVKYALFPFSIATYNSFSSMKKFDLKFHSSLSIIGIILSLIIGFMVKIKRREDLKSNWFDFVIISFTGIYGLLGIILIKTDLWK